MKGIMLPPKLKIEKGNFIKVYFNTISYDGYPNFQPEYLKVIDIARKKKNGVWKIKVQSALGVKYEPIFSPDEGKWLFTSYI